MSGNMRIFPLIAFGLYMMFYYFHNQQRVPVTGRKHLVDTSIQQDAALGLQSYQEILKQSQVIQSGPQVDMIRRVGERLKKVVDDPGFQWEFNLIQSNQVNAFCLPGGKVAVYSGILPIVQNENGLAVVMGHEISHAIARHGAERMAEQKLVELGTLAVGVSASNMDPLKRAAVMGALGVGAQYGILLPFSREQESEADYMGLIYLSRACYDPTEAPKLWERMSASASGSPSEFMSTHPSHATRIHQFQQWMPEAQDERAKHCGGGSSSSPRERDRVSSALAYRGQRRPAFVR